MILKLGMEHRGLKIYKVYINDYPPPTLTYFTAKSNLASYAFEWSNLSESHLMANDKWAKAVCIYIRQFSPGGCLSLPRDHIHVHENIFKHLLQKSLANQSYFCGASLGRGN